MSDNEGEGVYRYAGDMSTVFAATGQRCRTTSFFGRKITVSAIVKVIDNSIAVTAFITRNDDARSTTLCGPSGDRRPVFGVKH